jgi:propanol-preferring alcohol dehydrogenase
MTMSGVSASNSTHEGRTMPVQPSGSHYSSASSVAQSEDCQVRAFQVVAWGKPPELREVADPIPAPGQIVVKVGGAGACHSDLHTLKWEKPPRDNLSVPFTLGHETAGWVEAVGSGVVEWQPGAAVAVYGGWGCGICRACRSSSEHLCETPRPGGGLGRDGGMAEYMLVPSARHLIPLGDLDPREAAPLTDAALTPYHAIKLASPHLLPGAVATVIGVGGLGHMAIQILRAVSPVRIVAVDVDDSKLAFATAVGADDVVGATGGVGGKIRELTSGRGADLVLDFVGSDPTMALAVSIARAGGSVMIVGLGKGTLPLAQGTVPWDCSVTIPFWGSALELLEVLELARAGRIRAHVTRFPLEQAPEAYRQLRAGAIEGRAVITPHG